MVEPRQRRIDQEGYQVQLLAGGSPQHEEAERELLAHGVPLPLPHRAAWARFRPAAGFWFLLVRDSRGECAGGFMVEVSRSRALPGHLLLMSERFGDSLPSPAAAPALGALADLARRDRRILRLDVEIFSPDADRRHALAEALEGAGFSPAPLSRSYPETLTADLALSDEEHLAALSANTRRHVRAINKRPVALRLIEDAALAPRMDALIAETLQRTGGAYEPEDWRWKIELSRSAPEQSRLIGLFHTEIQGPESLLAFAWGCCHGEYAHYDAAGSTRRTDLKMSFAYALMWDLMCWARHNGARWFDFGGITEGHRDSDDPVGGISDFKRHFGSTVQQVGERWTLEPSPIRSGLVRTVLTIAHAIRPQRGRGRQEVDGRSGIVTPAAVPKARGWTRHFRLRMMSTWAMLPLYRELGHAWVLRATSEWTRGIRGRLLLTTASTALVLIGIMIHDPLLAYVLVPLALVAALIVCGTWLERQRRLHAIGRGAPSVGGLPSARQTLLAMGVDAATAERVAAAAQQGEVRLAIFDYESRVLSEIGPIPFFEGFHVTAEAFKDRDRHNLELVIAREVVCVKKLYLDRTSFENELRALHALSGLPGVPRIVAVRFHPRVLYQSFVLGRNLGTIMGRHGATDEVQQQVSVSFAAGDRWNPATEGARETAVAALSASVAPEIVAKLSALIERIHERGVTIGDIKYGNVLLLNDQPSLCDFDFATVFRRNGWRCARVREIDREKFNYFFNGGVLSEREFRRAMSTLLREREELRATRIHYGFGYVSQHQGSLEKGSGQWHLVRRLLPDPAGRHILSLGCDGGLSSLEMLRAGARQVTMYEPDPTLARYVRLSHQWFEFIDNRQYPAFQLLQGSIVEAGARDWPDYDIAMALGGFNSLSEEALGRLVARLGQTIETLVVRAGVPRDPDTGAPIEQSSLPFLRKLLARSGYPHQRVFERPFDERPLLIGRRSPG